MEETAKIGEKNPLIFTFGATDGSLPYVLDYSPIILIGTPFSMTAIALSSMVRADGSPLLAMGSFLIGTILNFIQYLGIK